MQTVKLLANGRLVIPAPLRRQLAIEPGNLLELRVTGDHIELRPLPRDPIAAFSGSLAGGESLAQGLARDR